MDATEFPPSHPSIPALTFEELSPRKLSPPATVIVAPQQEKPRQTRQRSASVSVSITTGPRKRVKAEPIIARKPVSRPPVARPSRSVSVSKAPANPKASTSRQSRPAFDTVTSHTKEPIRERTRPLTRSTDDPPLASSTVPKGKSELRAFLKVPDYKALHAAEAALRASQRPKPKVTVPESPAFVSKLRARERAEFDEMMRLKMEQKEREEEEQRTKEKEEEEKEIAEIRRKAVPRAHEVPAWYADAPRKGTL